MLGVMGLTEAQIQSLSGIMRRSLREQGAKAAISIEESDLALFAPEERRIVVHWLYMNRMCLGRRQLIQRWRTPSPYVFI